MKILVLNSYDKKINIIDYNRFNSNSRSELNIHSLCNDFLRLNESAPFRRVHPRSSFAFVTVGKYAIIYGYSSSDSFKFKFQSNIERGALRADTVSFSFAYIFELLGDNQRLCDISQSAINATYHLNGMTYGYSEIELIPPGVDASERA